MAQFFCITEGKQVFTLNVTPTTNRETCQQYWKRGENPPAAILAAAIRDPHGTNWPDTVARARRAANGCSIYGTDPRLDHNAQLAA